MGGCCGKMSDKRRGNKNSKQEDSEERTIERQCLLKKIDSFWPILDQNMKLKILQINAVNKRVQEIDWALNRLDHVRYQNNESLGDLIDTIKYQTKNFPSWYPTEENTGYISGSVEIQPTTDQICGTDSLQISSDNEEQLVLKDIENTVCTICLEPITDVGLADVCIHCFCIDCLQEWTEQHNSCPLCRQVIEEILVFTPDRHPNDFDRIVVDNEETRERLELIESCTKLKNCLVELRDVRVHHIDSLNNRVEFVNVSRDLLDEFGKGTNEDIQKAIDYVLRFQEIMRCPFD